MSNAERGAAAGGAADGGAAGQGDAAGHGGAAGGGVSRDGGATNAVEQTLRHLRTLDAPVEETEDTSSQGPLTLEDLYKQHRMRLVRLAILLVDEPATAEDVVQEAFTGLHRNWAKLRDAAAAVGYLRAAVVNGSRSVLRRRKTAREYVPPHAVNARSAESLAMLSTEHQAVVKALSQLPPRQREVLVLRYYGGLSESEISEATGISKGTVKSTASRALEALQRTMPDSKR